MSFYRYAENLNLCLDNHGLLATCPSNCIGVDPNAVVVGGTAIVAASALGALVLPPYNLSELDSLVWPPLVVGL